MWHRLALAFTCSPINQNSKVPDYTNFRPINFLSQDLGRVYYFDLRIHDAIVFANTYIAISRPIGAGANSIFSHIYFLSLYLRRIYNFDPKIYDPTIVFAVVTMEQFSDKSEQNLFLTKWLSYNPSMWMSTNPLHPLHPRILDRKKLFWQIGPKGSASCPRFRQHYPTTLMFSGHLRFTPMWNT